MQVRSVWFPEEDQRHTQRKTERCDIIISADSGALIRINVRAQPDLQQNSCRAQGDHLQQHEHQQRRSASTSEPPGYISRPEPPAEPQEPKEKGRVKSERSAKRLKIQIWNNQTGRQGHSKQTSPNVQHVLNSKLLQSDGKSRTLPLWAVIRLLQHSAIQSALKSVQVRVFKNWKCCMNKKGDIYIVQ